MPQPDRRVALRALAGIDELERRIGVHCSIGRVADARCARPRTGARPRPQSSPSPAISPTGGAHPHRSGRRVAGRHDRCRSRRPLHRRVPPFRVMITLSFTSRCGSRCQACSTNRIGRPRPCGRRRGTHRWGVHTESLMNELPRLHPTRGLPCDVAAWGAGVVRPGFPLARSPKKPCSVSARRPRS